MKKQKGKVFLVGAGPGDPGLLTLRGAEILRSADAVVYDRLVNPILLQFASCAEKFFAGKDPVLKKKGAFSHPEYLPQEKINRLLVKLARQKKKVVRLKGGDPFIFGRGGEEASVLKKAGIPFEIVPGVSAAHAVPAYAGIPVTDRRFASAVTFLTAHENNLKDEKLRNWKELAHVPGTLVLFMGVKTFPEIMRALLEGGKSPKTPVSVIEQGTLPRQRVIEGTLRTIAQKIKNSKIKPPALAVIGKVNCLRRDLNWFHPGKKTAPLSGKTVLLTRAGAQSRQFKQTLESEGALVRDFPVIRILPPKNWKPVDAVIRKIVATKRLRRHSRMVLGGNPQVYGSPTKSRRALYARALFGQNLTSCSEVFGDDKPAFDWILFTSVNGAASFFQRLRTLGKDSRILEGIGIAAIGEATRERLLEKGIAPDLMPGKFTSEALVAELARKNKIKGRHFLLPRTDIAPSYLKEALEKRGGKVTQVIVYRTVPACGAREKERLHGWLERKEIDFITFTSASTADNFFSLLPKAKRARMTAHSRFISIGPVTSQALRKHGARPWREAEEHTVKGMLETLIHGSR